MPHEPGEPSAPIFDLLQHRISDPQASNLREQIKQDPKLLRQALHYASHHAAMRRSVATPLPATPADSIWRKMKQNIGNWLQYQTPVWQVVPVAAVLIAVITVLSIQQQKPQQNQLARLINFEDTPTIQFIAQNAQPGIDFFPVLSNRQNRSRVSRCSSKTVINWSLAGLP